jgi:haloalkane dehalogenase
VEDIRYLRTPDARFEDLPDFPYAPRYARVPGGLRMHFVDEGPRDGAVVVLLHGEPSWSFLYRSMIPILVAERHRVVAPDLIGFGRSDKPVDRAAHTYQRHVQWTQSLLFDHLDLRDVTLFAQDWGGLIGLRVVAEHPGRFARIAVANTGLPTGDHAPSAAFLNWRRISQEMPEFQAGRVVQGGSVRALAPQVVAAYDAPFPDSTYQAGPRVMPVLVPIAPDDPAADANRAAWQVLRSWTKPFVTFFSDGDPVTAAWAEPLRANVPGARNQPHQTIADAGHFVQEDKGEELARLISSFVQRSGR